MCHHPFELGGAEFAIVLRYIESAWPYRQFVFASIRGELKGRFARSKIGGAWFVLHPLAQALIFALILSEVLGARIGGVDNKAAYSIYLMAGLAVWGLHSEITTRFVGVFFEFQNVLKKINFPRICLPFVVVGMAIFNHLLLVLAIVVIFAFFDHFPTIHWVALPVGAILTCTLASGLGIITGVLNVYSRDVAQVMTVIMQMWFWLTPIVYTADILPDSMQGAIALNPMTGLAGMYQDIMLYHQWPDWSSLVYPAIIAIVLALLAILVFRRASAEIVDML
ncbi:MAG: ABC transporter permease [Pseudomonadota bacterium]